MKYPSFIFKINWRLILTHLVASCFLVIATKQWVVLNDIEIIELVDKHGYPEALKYLVKQDNFETRLGTFANLISFAPLIGLLFAFLLSLILTLKKKALGLNSFLVLITGMLLNKKGFFSHSLIDTIFYAPGEWISRFGLCWKFVANGVILTLAGMFIFFSKWTIDFAFTHPKVETEQKQTANNEVRGL